MAENSLAVAQRTDTTNVETTRNGKYFTPRVDIFETDTELLLLADLPGVAPGDIDLRYENGELVVQGKVQPHERKGHLILGEYEEGDFYRVFQIHESIDSARIEAECKNGVLTVHLPKAEAAKPKQVTVKAK
ncbi:MAG: Hsp20/alpha crystallin family protein [Gemmataceae bacterium]|nr:Hsp20/alpha crystallin family protein [Gemmataceae bacterium]